MNLGAAPPLASTPGDTDEAETPAAAEPTSGPSAGGAAEDLSSTPPMHLQEPLTELAHLEGESGESAGQRKRTSRWRLRP